MDRNLLLAPLRILPMAVLANRFPGAGRKRHDAGCVASYRLDGERVVALP